MPLGDAADRRRIGDPPGAPRERGCPAAGCQGRRGAWRPGGVMRGGNMLEAAGMHGRDCDRLADI